MIMLWLTIIVKLVGWVVMTNAFQSLQEVYKDNYTVRLLGYITLIWVAWVMADNFILTLSELKHYAG